jgi:zinc/manganese transport system permease protein
LLLLPPATAQLVTARPAPSLALSIAIGLVTVWSALFVAVYSTYPIGFWLTTIAFGLYVVVGVVTRLGRVGQRGGRSPAVRREPMLDGTPS